MPTFGPYSELEYLILAMIGEGVTSGYAMRKQMNRMRGGRWSAESGSVYRVLRRLEVDGLAKEARRVGVPNRERTEYELTESGSAALHSWLFFPPDRAEYGFMVDPIRTRSYFLPRLSHAEQGRVIKNWMIENKRYIEEITREMDEMADLDHPMRKEAFSNLVFLGQARQEWLRRMLATHRALVRVPTDEISAEDLLVSASSG